MELLRTTECPLEKLVDKNDRITVLNIVQIKKSEKSGSPFGPGFMKDEQLENL